jgi:hypothetical protein
MLYSQHIGDDPEEYAARGVQRTRGGESLVALNGGTAPGSRTNLEVKKQKKKINKKKEKKKEKKNNKRGKNKKEKKENKRK